MKIILTKYLNERIKVLLLICLWKTEKTTKNFSKGRKPEPHKQTKWDRIDFFLYALVEVPLPTVVLKTSSQSSVDAIDTQ